MPTKFNDAAGTTEQKICQNHCDSDGYTVPPGNETSGGIQDVPRAEMGRRDGNGSDMDINYYMDGGVAELCCHLAKCWTCPHWLKYKAEIEA